MSESLKLLVVDDEEDFLSVISRRIERRGHEARRAATCMAALETLESWTPDAVVLDVKLPDMDGIECLKRIKDKWPKLPVVLLTGHASMNAAIACVTHGASDYCLKPVDFDYLMERIVIAIDEAGEKF